jgi:hypothetical protein
MTIDYLYRLPEFPIICSIGDILITARSDAEFQHRLNSVTLSPDIRYNAIDASGATWELNPNQMYIVPTLRRKWSKKKIIQTYNGSKNCQSAGPYSERSLSSKRFEIVFSDIVQLIEQSQ